ncbi:hypothetical protein P171DRAFT_452095 [Karstenula rhodostoma CBS 690.94]|uniref:Rhodopsin domain-containing protein n=1 Tax=Karstenula rhodostoma CBS 690.94 TaxID=1392251 RepID=A0A9P4PRL8_9PLEO|nr:hypothetical protein P171DRAFT_452095 [Karstenula rhodostoma CBS 690.94]
MSVAPTEALPLDGRSKDIKTSVVVLIAFSSILVGLLLYVSRKKHIFFQATDHFLWTGHSPADLEKYLKWLSFGQLLNLYGMALIKLSICPYILKLDFTRLYRIIIWLSHWDIAATQSGSCWGDKSRETLWGVRAVFLLGLVTTSISALKLYEMKSLYASSDPTYASVNLSIFAVSEVFVGAFTASLPPLRKTFETLLRRVLPESSMGSGAPSNVNGKYAKPKHVLDNDS